MTTGCECGGTGQCATCEGTGTYPDFSSDPPVEVPCDECEGSGECPVCFGQDEWDVGG